MGEWSRNNPSLRWRIKHWRRWLLDWFLPDYAAELNRRCEVEEALRAAAAGKRALPDAQECRLLANKLGINL